MYMDKNIKHSYLPMGMKARFEREETWANNILKELQRVVEDHGENLCDAVNYQKEGWDYKIKAKKEECRRYLDKMEVPEYMREDFFTKAVESLGAKNIRYFENIRDIFVNLKYDNTVNGKVVDLSNEVEIREGKWVIKQSFMESQRKAHIKQFTEEQEKDLSLFMAMCVAIEAFEQRGYYPLMVYKHWGKVTDTNDDEFLEKFLLHKIDPQTKEVKGAVLAPSFEKWTWEMAQRQTKLEAIKKDPEREKNFMDFLQAAEKVASMGIGTTM